MSASWLVYLKTAQDCIILLALSMAYAMLLIRVRSSRFDFAGLVTLGVYNIVALLRVIFDLVGTIYPFFLCVQTIFQSMIWIAIYYFVHEMQTVKIILESESVRIFKRTMKKVKIVKYFLMTVISVFGIIQGIQHFVIFTTNTDLIIDGVISSTRLFTDGYIYILFVKLIQFFCSQTLRK